MRELRKSPALVTLVDKNNFHTFQPLLYQVATAELSPTEVGLPVRDMLHDRSDWLFHRASVAGVDLDRREVEVEGMTPIPYDYLVVAIGAVVNYFGTKGAAENAFPLYSMNDAVMLKTHILERFEAVDRDPSLIDDGALTFCVVGGGSTGVEVAGALAELILDQLRSDYPNLPADKIRVHLYEMGPELLAPFKPNLRAYARKALEERDVVVHTGEGVGEIEATRVHLKSGEVVNTHTLVWAAGLTAHPLAASLVPQLEHGRAPVNPDLSLPGHPEVFVVGDIALITDSKTNQQLPQLGSVAQQAGVQTGQNIARMIKGESSRPFEYTDKGTMATIGRGAAVVEFRRGRTITGHAAWLAWLGVHLMLLSGGEERGLTFLNWSWNILSNSRGKRMNLDQEIEAMRREAA